MTDEIHSLAKELQELLSVSESQRTEISWLSLSPVTRRTRGGLSKNFSLLAESRQLEGINVKAVLVSLKRDPVASVEGGDFID